MRFDQEATLGAIRRIILAILAFALIGTAAELLFLGHDQGVLQLAPLILIAMGLSVIGWHFVSATSVSLQFMRVTMGAFIVAGALGIGLHYRGSAEFQKETDPSIHGFVLFMKVLQSKAPPALAPATMAQIGLLGLAYTYRHPAYSGDK